MQTNVLIVGGGLAGLSLASKLSNHGVDFHLVEARSRFGGRIKTSRKHGAYFDLGPAWFWQEQPRILQLVRELGLPIFEQYSAGILTYEDESGQVQRGRGYASMEGSLRLEGGLLSLIDALELIVSPGAVSLKTRVQTISTARDGLHANIVKDGEESTIQCKQIVLCLPPRIAAQTISYNPSLPIKSVQAMENIATWMAGQAKAVAVYDKPFWRDAGLSGDAMSRVGPMVEVHDASPNDASCGALFGFIGVPSEARKEQQLLQDAVLAQLVRLFGDGAAKPKELVVKDWAYDVNTATPLDHAPVYAHPTYGLPAELTGLMDGRLHFGSTEVASQFGGYLEGALEASEKVVKKLLQQMQRDVDSASE